jgi:hypothetical protein
MLQIEQVRASVQHHGFLRLVIVYGIGVIWFVLQVYLGLLLPRMILNRKVRHDNHAD